MYICKNACVALAPPRQMSPASIRGLRGSRVTARLRKKMRYECADLRSGFDWLTGES